MTAVAGQEAAGGRWARLRWPASWLFVVLTVLGAVVLASAFGVVAVRNPLATITAVVLFTLHGVVFALVLRTIDYLEPEPVWMLVAALIWGGVIAAGNALRANVALESILTKLTSLTFVRDWAAAVEGPTDEEILKTLGIVALVLLARRNVNSVLDGLVYGAFVGLGFQEVENVIYSLNAVVQADVDSAGPVVQTFVVRGLLTGLWSHTVYSAIAGAGVAYAALRTDRSWARRLGVALAALLAAWSCHFLWNSPLLDSATGGLPGAYGPLFAVLVKGALILTLFLVLLWIARRGEYRPLTAELAAQGDPRLATPAEIAALRTARTRRSARWNAFVAGGLVAIRPVRRLQRAQADLAVALNQGRPTGAIIDRVYAQRQRLTQFGVAEATGARRSSIVGWVSVAAAVLCLFFPFLLVVPIGVFASTVPRARRRGVAADPKVRTGLELGLVLTVVWLIDAAARSAGLG
ncbi:MAG TPA: PrsW family intramembrane metalloprotease [Micromonosporaceae bacterium]|jgi:RsiW-degrading membrane proteinase PrsW (M82 family)